MSRGAALLMAGVSAVAGVSGCGYHAVYGHGGERFRVVLVRSLIPDAIASDEVVSGARETLAREGALAGGDGYPRIEVEVLRADESSEGVAASSAALGGSLSTQGTPTGPRARGTEEGLLARACLVRSRGGPCERDTGDVRAMDLVASDVTLGAPDLVSDAMHHRDARRATARRLGERLARHVLGEAGATDESPGRER